MKFRPPIAAAAIALAGATALAPAATAVTNTQEVTASIADSITVTLSKTSVPFGALGVGANVVPTATAGTLGVQANVAYTVKVHAAKATMTKYVSGAYDDLVKLANGLSMTTTSLSVGAVPVSAAVIGNDSTNPTLVASSVATSSDHLYDLSFAQTVAPADAKTTYRNELTYTTTATL